MKTVKVGLLHTASIHIDTFAKLFAQMEPDCVLSHVVQDTWLERARDEGLSPDLKHEIADALRFLVRHSDAVLCTCSSIASVVDDLAAEGLPLIRIDRPMMEKATECSGKTAVAYCLESTREPTMVLLEQVFEEKGIPLAVCEIFCEKAWPAFEAKDLKTFGQAIAQNIKAMCRQEAEVGCVLLAQASMAVAEPLLQDLDIPVYASPALAVEAVLKIARQG